MPASRTLRARYLFPVTAAPLADGTITIEGERIVAVGANGSLPHYRPGNVRIKANDSVLIDWGAAVGGYCSDLTRVVFTGRISPQIARIYVVALRAQAAGIAAVRVGATGEAADAAARDPGESQIALVAAPRVVLTGSQVSFGYEERDSRLAFTRLQGALEQAGASMRDMACARYYPLAAGLAGQVRKIRAEFFDPAHGPAGTLLVFEGLPSLDAGFAVDAVAAKD